MQASIALLARSFEVISVSRVFFQFDKAGIGIMGGSAIGQSTDLILPYCITGRVIAIAFQHVTHPVSVLLMASHPVFLSFSSVSKVLR